MSVARRSTVDSNLLLDNDEIVMTDVRRHSKYSQFLDIPSERIRVESSDSTIQKSKSPRIFSHFSQWRQIWEYIILFVSGLPIIEVSFICIYCIDMPFYFYIPCLIGDALFIYDYYVVTRTEYLSNGVSVTNVNRIKHHYGNLARWIHIIGALPISWIGLLFHKWWIFLIFSLTRLLRLHRCLYASDTIMTSLRYTSWTTAFFPLLYLLLVCIHILASMFYLSAYFEGTANSWIGILGWDYLTKPQQYIVSVYFVMTTILTIGFGDLTPQTSPETILVIFIQLSGVMFNAYVVSVMVKYLLDPIGSNFLQSFYGLQDYMKFKGVDEDTRREVIYYAQDAWEASGGAPAPDDAFKFVPETVRDNLKLALAEKCFRRVPLLQSSSEATRRAFADILRPVKYIPGEDIFKKNDIKTEMILLTKGFVTYAGLEANCSDGFSTGELDLLVDIPKLATLTTLSYVYGWVIRREDLLDLIVRRPEIRRELLSSCKILYQQYYKQIRRLLFRSVLNVAGRQPNVDESSSDSSFDDAQNQESTLFCQSSSSDSNALSA